MIKLANRIFRKKEILCSDKFYTFCKKKKVVVFVPLKFLELLTLEMSKAGAGKIGNYEMCSFRTEGIGTYKPNDKAKPFAGKKNALYYSDEIKLEMECSTANLNKVIDTMIRHHPYEEIAYEIHDFRKRDLISKGEIIDLRSSMKYSVLLSRLNEKIVSIELSENIKFNRIAISSEKAGTDLVQSAKFLEAECLLLFSKNNYKLFKL